MRNGVWEAPFLPPTYAFISGNFDASTSHDDAP